jgi:hypothetical protein
MRNETLIELKKTDDILRFILSTQGEDCTENKLKAEGLFCYERLAYLQSEGLISRLIHSATYILTQKGIIFISMGGYEAEWKKMESTKKLNTFYLFVTPACAFLSLALSITTLCLTYNRSGNLNFSSKFDISFPEKKDTALLLNDSILIPSDATSLPK